MRGTQLLCTTCVLVQGSLDGVTPSDLYGKTLSHFQGITVPHKTEPGRKMTINLPREVLSLPPRGEDRPFARVEVHFVDPSSPPANRHCCAPSPRQHPNSVFCFCFCCCSCAVLVDPSRGQSAMHFRPLLSFSALAGYIIDGPS